MLKPRKQDAQNPECLLMSTLVKGEMQPKGSRGRANPFCWNESLHRLKHWHGLEQFLQDETVACLLGIAQHAPAACLPNFSRRYVERRQPAVLVAQRIDAD